MTKGTGDKMFDIETMIKIRKEMLMDAVLISYMTGQTSKAETTEQGQDILDGYYDEQLREELLDMCISL